MKSPKSSQIPGVKNSGIVKEFMHKSLGAIPFLQPPVWMNGERLGSDSASPVLGEHTTQVLREIGYNEESISSLREAGVIR